MIVDNQKIEQIIKQLNKVIQVIEVKNRTKRPCIERKLMLTKFSYKLEQRHEILDIANIFGAKVVDLSKNSITIEVVGDPDKIFIIQQLLGETKTLKIIRSGKIAISRELGINTEYLNTT